MSMLGLQGSFLILDILSLAQDTLPFAGRNSGDIVHHVQQHFQFRFQLRHYSLLPYQKLQARQLRQLEQNIQALPVLIYTFMELLAGISLAAIEQWGNSWSGYTGVFNWYFPISPSQVYAACLTKHTKNISSSHNWEPARVEEWNNSYARIHPDGDLGYSVIAICKAQQQWRNNPGLWAIPFTEFVAGGITMTRTGSQSSGTWYGDSGTISLTGYTASCATNESWVSNISGSAIAVGL